MPLPRLWTIAFTALCMLASGAAHAQDTVSAPRVQRVEEGLLTAVTIRGRSSEMPLLERMRFYNVPGVSIAVIDDGRIAWARAYGVKRAGGTEPVDTATLFQAASISKPVSAIAALRLVEQGRLSLDADVNASLTSWRLEENGFTRRQPVTLRRLLSHNAGLTVHGFRGYASGEDVPTLVQVLGGEQPANSAAVRPDTIPGSIWRYSGGGSSVVQQLMEDITGKSFPALLRELVLEPADMVHSGFEQPLPAHRVAAAATGHRPGGQPVAGAWHTYPEMFAAGLWTTPLDLARLAIEVQRAAAERPGSILSPATAREMLTVQAGAYGLGFGLEPGDGWTGFSHGGANEGYRALLYAMTNGRGAVVMTNGDNGSPLAAEILRAIAREYDWPVYRTVERDVVELTPAQLRSFAGDYTFQRNGQTLTLSLAAADGSLVSAGPPLGERTLYYGGSDSFFLLASPGVLRFERDAAGRVSAVVLEGAGPPLRLQRRQ
ncbi:hypothetical protein BH23GEM9_BH23GEM9_11110 [soil metagenome]